MRAAFTAIDKRGAKESAKRIARGLLTEWLQALAVLTEITLLCWPAVGTIQPGLVTGTEAIGVALDTQKTHATRKRLKLSTHALSIGRHHAGTVSRRCGRCARPAPREDGRKRGAFERPFFAADRGAVQPLEVLTSCDGTDTSTYYACCPSCCPA